MQKPRKKSLRFGAGFVKLSAGYDHFQGPYGFSCMVLKRKDKKLPFLQIFPVMKENGKWKPNYNRAVQVPIIAWAKVFGKEGIVAKCVNEVRANQEVQGIVVQAVKEYYASKGSLRGELF